MFYEPSKGHGLPHDPFKALVAPRPIGWISTISAAGDLNLAPYSYFNAYSSNPYLVMFSSQGAKDSVSFARETGQFVVNLASADLFDAMVISSTDAPRGQSEFSIAGLTPKPSSLVAPPRVGEAHSALECEVIDIQEPKGLDGNWAGVYLVMGEVVGIHIDDDMIENGLFDITKAGNVARLGYMDYLKTSKIFSASRPSWKGS